MTWPIPKYSIIIPVYNRPQEISELLESLTKQTYKQFEVIVVEDGSAIRCDDVVDGFREKLNIRYFFKPNSGPGPSRNFGYGQSSSQYMIVFDSDCIIPPQYLEAVERSLSENSLDAWGGPDKGHESFTATQRAMGYTMSSVLTTGGIRGAKKHMGWFQPRSFNMGISRTVFEKTGGFKFDRFAEDIEFSIRMKKAGFEVGLIPEAFVFHKRRTTFAQFYKQVFNFGRGRALVGKVHPGEVKPAHWFPTFFFIGLIATPFAWLININLFWLAVAGYVFYWVAIFIDAFRVNKNLLVACLSVPSSMIQLIGYGIGFLKEQLKPYTP